MTGCVGYVTLENAKLEQATEAFADALRESSSIRHLDIEFSRLEESESRARALFDAIRDHSGLETLNLRLAKISDATTSTGGRRLECSTGTAYKASL